MLYKSVKPQIHQKQMRVDYGPLLANFNIAAMFTNVTEMET